MHVDALAPGPVIGEAYAAELQRALAEGQPVLADDALSVLSWLLPPGTRTPAALVPRSG